MSAMRAVRWAVLPLLGMLMIAVTMAQEEEHVGQEEEIADDGLTHEEREREPMSPEKLRALHEKIDNNGNGKVSKKEMMVMAYNVGKVRAGKDIEDILKEIDKNQDGMLSLAEHLEDYNAIEMGAAEEVEELEARKEAETKKHKAADLNKDGMLDSTELPAFFYPETHEDVLSVTVEESLRQKDKDKDGKLTNVEFWESQADGDTEDELSEEEKDDFKALDKDSDGFLDVEELREWESGTFHTRAAMETIFGLADKDKDDLLTADELADAADLISSSDAQHHLFDWDQHAAEL